MMVERLAQHWHTTPDVVERQDRALVDQIMEGIGIRRIFETPGSRLSPVERRIVDDLLSYAPADSAPAGDGNEDGGRRAPSLVTPEEFARRKMLSRRAKASGEVG